MTIGQLVTSLDRNNVREDIQIKYERSNDLWPFYDFFKAYIF